MNGGDMESVLGTHGFCAVFLLLCISVFFRVNPKRYLLMAFFLLLAANIANIYTVYHYYGIGMWEEYGQYRNTFFSLVGNYNGGIEYVMPMAICGFSWASRYGGWLEMINYAAVVASLFMAVKCDSLTQMIAYAAILVFMAAGDFSFLSRKYAAVLRTIFQPLILIAVNLAVFVSVVVLNQTNWVAYLGIDPDFHNRRHIWNMSMDWIRENPVWGSGQETVAQEAAKITGYAHSHCTFLEVAYKTGFVGTVFLLLLLAASTVAVYRCRHHHLAYVLSVLAFLMGLAAIAETYPMEYVILCLGLVYYIALSSNRKDTAAKVVRVNV